MMAAAAVAQWIWSQLTAVVAEPANARLKRAEEVVVAVALRQDFPPV
jgi:hypothetical protein